MWHIGIIVPRVFTFVLLASTYTPYVFVVFGIHMIMMLLEFYLTDAKRGKLRTISLGLVICFVRSFIFFPKESGKSQGCRLFFYHAVIFVENTVVFGVLWFKGELDPVTAFIAITFIWGAFSIGIFSMLVYTCVSKSNNGDNDDDDDDNHSNHGSSRDTSGAGTNVASHSTRQRNSAGFTSHAQSPDSHLRRNPRTTSFQNQVVTNDNQRLRRYSPADPLHQNFSAYSNHQSNRQVGYNYYNQWSGNETDNRHSPNPRNAYQHGSNDSRYPDGPYYMQSRYQQQQATSYVYNPRQQLRQANHNYGLQYQNYWCILVWYLRLFSWNLMAIKAKSSVDVTYEIN